MYTEAQKRAKKKYDDKTYSYITIKIKKDDATAITVAAQKAGKSRTAFILDAVKKQLDIIESP